MVAEIQTAQDVWPVLNPVVFVPHEESEYHGNNTDSRRYCR